mgnify:FL=1
MGNRKHSKIDALPTDIKEAVEQMILGNYTYRDICNFVQETANVTLSQTAVCNYAKGLNATVQDLRLASENMRTLTGEMAKYPQLDTTEGIARLISHKVLQAVRELDDEALRTSDPLKLIDRCTGLIRAVAYKNENDTRTKNIKDMAFESFKEEIFDAMVSEAPELYAQLVKFISAKKEDA